jgi:hypothetical protein
LKYLTLHLDQIVDPSVYLPALTFDSPLINFVTPEMIKTMVPRCPDQLNKSWIQSALINGYLVPDIISFVASYFQTLLSNRDLDIKHVQELRKEEVLLAHSLFLINQSVESAVQFASVLKANKDVLDSVHLVIKRTANLDTVRFLPVIVLLNHQSLSAEEDERMIIYAQSSTFPYYSRNLALQIMVQRSPRFGDVVFRYAALETSDPRKLQEATEHLETEADPTSDRKRPNLREQELGSTFPE